MSFDDGGWFRSLGRGSARLLTRIGAVRRLLRWASLGGYLPAGMWRRLPPNVPAVRVSLACSRGFDYAVHAEDPFARELFWRGVASPEGASILAFEDIVRDARLVLDVGAHTGLYTLTALAAAPSSRVIAFEPVPVNGAALRANLAGNSWSERCEVRGEAVADEIGTIQMHIPSGDHPMSASLSLTGFRGLRGRLIDVGCTTVDAALREGTRVDVVKIDVEGFEDRVLRGMNATISRWRPKMMIECNPDGPYPEVERILREHRYRFLHVDGRSHLPEEHIIPDLNETYRNFLCLPE